MERSLGNFRKLTPLVFGPLLLATASIAQAQSVSGRESARLAAHIIDAQSGQPIPNAELLLLRFTDTLARGRADNQGRFTASGSLGEQFTLEVRRLGYLPVSQAWNAETPDTQIVIKMTVVPLALAGVEVRERASMSARLKGFESRAGTRAGGTFIQRAQIDAWHPRRTSDLMRRVLGVKLIDSSGAMLAVSTRGEKVDLRAANAARSWAPCVMRVGVDGQVKEWGFPMDLVDPNDIHGIEVYNGPASIPSEFGGLRTDSFCGLVMIWTRSGY